MIIMQNFCLKRLKHLTALIYFILFASLGFMRTTFAQDEAVDQKEESVEEKNLEEKPILEIKPLPEGKNLYSIELRNVPLYDLFRVLAHDYHLNIIVDSNIKGTITASFTNVSLDEALNSIAEVSNLALKKKGNIIRVHSNISSRSFKLKYLDATQIVGAVTSSSQESSQSSSSSSQQQSSEEESNYNFQVASTILQLLSDKGKVLFGSEPNSIMVIDYSDNIKKVEKYLDVIDREPKQVLIEARFVEVQLTGENALGINWQAFAQRQGLEMGQFRVGSSQGGALEQQIPFKNTIWPPHTATGTQESPFTVTIFDDNINVVLNALANSLKTNVLSAPRVTTVNNRPAEIKIVQSLPWAEPEVEVLDNGGVAVTWEIHFEDVGIILKVTPVINSDDKITMLLEPEVSEKVGDFELTVVQGTTSVPYTVPIIDKRTASTKVVIGNNQTLIIGGLIKDQLIKQETKVPLLGDMPFLGPFFRSKKDIKDKKELIIFVSPTIVDKSNLAKMKKEEERIGAWYLKKSKEKKLVELPRKKLKSLRREFESRYMHLKSMYDSLKEEREKLGILINTEKDSLQNIEEQMKIRL